MDYLSAGAAAAEKVSRPRDRNSPPAYPSRMPLSHRRLSSWYHQLAQQLAAGLRFADALRSSRGTGFPDTGLEAMAREIETGGTSESAWAKAEPWIPLSDQLVLSAAADVGRMPDVLNSLAARHRQLGAAKLRLILASAYPLVLVHVGLLVLPLTRMIDWDRGFTWAPAVYLRTLALTLMPLWLALIGLVTLMQRQNHTLTRVGRALPLVGRYLRTQALADFAFLLGNFLAAGMRIDRAWALTGSITAGPDLRDAAHTLSEIMARGLRPGPQLAAQRCFPPDFVGLYVSGEETGQLEANLLRLAATYQEHAQRALTLSAIVYPGIALLIVAGAVVYHVITFYAGYLKMIEKLAT